MAERTFTVHIETTEPEVGIWCEPCALPSKVRVRAVMITGRGVSPLVTAEQCENCGAREIWNAG